MWHTCFYGNARRSACNLISQLQYFQVHSLENKGSELIIQWKHLISWTGPSRRGEEQQNRLILTLFFMPFSHACDRPLKQLVNAFGGFSRNINNPPKASAKGRSVGFAHPWECNDCLCQHLASVPGSLSLRVIVLTNHYTHPEAVLPPPAFWISLSAKHDMSGLWYFLKESWKTHHSVNLICLADSAGFMTHHVFDIIIQVALCMQSFRYK